MPNPDAELTKLCGTCGFRLEAVLGRCPADGARLGRARPEVAILGSYRLVELLGSGGMGAVYRAVHEKLGRTVAIKVLNRSLLADRTNIARFFQEARSVNTIRHPNVVDIYDFVTAGKDIYTVMEFLTGQDLHHALYRHGGRPFAFDRAAAIIEQICGGLQAAHDRSIIHRDLKPANVFLTPREGNDEFVKLLDFGLAKLERTEGRMTRDGVVLGTPEYMAPEQARGGKIDHRADIYGVGCLGYHMFTGTQLFVGGTYADVMISHVKEPPPPPRSLNPDLPEGVERVLLRCLAKDPAQRPQSARAVAEELCAALGRPMQPSLNFVSPKSRAMMAVGDGPVAVPSAGFSAIVSRTLKLDRPSRRGFAFGAILVAAAGLALVMISSSKSPNARDLPAPSVAAATGPALQHMVLVRLQSNPSGATVLDQKGQRLGVTPHDLSVPAGSEHSIEFVLPGYRSERRAFRADFDTTQAAELEPLASDLMPPPAPLAAPVPPRQPRKRGAAHVTPSAESVSDDPDLDSRARTINPFDR